MKDRSLKLYYWYKRCMWYAGIFLQEIDGPLQIVKYTSYGAIVLKLVGWSFSVWDVVWISLIAMVVAVGVGILIVKTGAVKVTQALTNSQNPELLEILTRIKMLDRKETNQLFT